MQAGYLLAHSRCLLAASLSAPLMTCTVTVSNGSRVTVSLQSLPDGCKPISSTDGWLSGRWSLGAVFAPIDPKGFVTLRSVGFFSQPAHAIADSGRRNHSGRTSPAQARVRTRRRRGIGRDHFTNTSLSAFHKLFT